ncbi:MAG: MFS transporter [Desulfovibrio sp.]|nr:MFS transporter [Desulfovibrio sp.]
MEKKKLLLVTLGHMSCDVNGGALPAALPYLRAAHSLDYQATGGIMLAYSCLASLIQPIFGFWSDRHNKPWFIPVGILLAGTGICLLGFLGNYWLMCAAVAVSGVGSAFFHPEGARFANKVSGETKGTGLSLFSIGGNAGFIIGPLIVSVFCGAFGLHGLAIFLLIGATLASILFYQIFRLPGTGSSLDAGKASKKIDSQIAGENDWREFYKLLVVIVCRAMVFVGSNTFIPLYWVNEFGQSRSSGALALVIFGGFGIAFNLIGGFLADKLGFVKIIRIAFWLMFPAILIFGFVPGIYWAYAMLPFMGLVLYLSFSSQVALGQKLLAKNVGFASGITLGVASTLGGIAQPCLGWIADGSGLRSVFYCLASVALIGAVASLFLKKE